MVSKQWRKIFQIARLYEYYMIAMDETRMRGPLPRKIYLYFMHGNTLDYRKKHFYMQIF